MRSCSKAKLPLGEHGDWKVERFTITEDQAKMDRLRCCINPHPRMQPVEAGEYTKITRRGCIWMSDTPSEIYDMNQLLRQARGDVLVTGLGLGCLAVALCKQPTVSSVLVVEIEPAVVALVAPHIAHPKLTVVEADAFTWKPDRTFDTALHDIWMTICADDLEEHAKLRRHYQRAMRAPKRQFCWRETTLRFLRERGI